ncbi:MAG: tripartite tricarboxylate transporter TctB family protein [Actinomycetales bacterium]|nr:tripartite tricarboxylate transporter TctB family protein [Actinomycetales bacterium]
MSKAHDFVPPVDHTGHAERERAEHGHPVPYQLHWLGPLVPLLVGLYTMYEAYNLSLGELRNPGPGLWPFIVSTVVVGTAAALLFIDHRDDYETWTRGTLIIIGGLVSLGIFILLFEAIGFLVPAVLMLLLWLRLFAQESWKWALPLAVGGALVLYLIFDTALGVPFPDGVLVDAVTG